MLRVLCAIACCAAFAAEAPAAREPAQPLTFEHDIRPLLKAHCFLCHGEEPKPKGELDLRLVRLMTKGGESGPAIVAGKPAESLLIEKLRAGEMPPGDKKLPPHDIDLIARWLEQGAKTAFDEPADPTAAEFSPLERSHWAFQPIAQPPVPQVAHPDLVATPVDAFLLAQLEQQQLAFSPEADRRTLIRRASFDLLGLPPTPVEVEAFVADTAPGAWPRLIDRLLESPHYGERWGRLWLDVAGYADSDGVSDTDPVRPYAFNYRDYVIRAFNADKPLDDFVREQLAGDELLKAPYANLSTDEAERLVATGFLRMGPDGTSGAAADPEQARNDVLAETIKIVTTSLLGLSVGCAQCHAHRFDPISQADYYRMRAIFEPAYDVSHWKAPAARLVSLNSAAERQQMAEVDRQLKQIAAERVAALQAKADEIFAGELQDLDEEQQEQLRAAYAIPADKRTPQQRGLFKPNPKLNVNTGSVYLFEQKWVADLDKTIAARSDAARARRPAERFAQALTEPGGKLPVTHLFYRGDIRQPREIVRPGDLTVLCSAATPPLPDDDPQLPTSGRRTAYARHLTDGRHPLLARVLVNRVWLNHFGRGIVSTPADFGLHGERPSHPQLLDWLAGDLVSGGWRLKQLHKLLMTSTAYRQSSRRTPQLDAVDMENRLLGRMAVRRLEAEMVRDAVLAVSGKLNPKMFGPPVPVMPDDVGQIVLGVDTRDGAGRPTGKLVSLGDEAYRRSVYVQVRRSMPLSMLDTFDAPRLSPNCDLRSSSTVAPQSLLLLNNDFMLEQAAALAERVQKSAGSEPEAQARAAWQTAFAVEPTTTQLTEAGEFLSAATKLFAERAATAKASASAGQNPPPTKAAVAAKIPQRTPAEQALTLFCQALLSSNRFLYID